MLVAGSVTERVQQKRKEMSCSLRIERLKCGCQDEGAENRRKEVSKYDETFFFF